MQVTEGSRVMDSERAHEPEQPVSTPEAPAPDPPPSPDAPVAAEAAPAGRAAHPSEWRAQLAALASSAAEWLKQARVRLSLTGVLLLLIGGLLMTSSVWTLPLVIVGALMVAIAWIGHRLEGRFAVEWGQTGTQLAFRATIKAAQAGDAMVPAAVQTIDGEAHTVELDLSELKALIAAVEAGLAAAPGDGVAQDIQIRRIVPGGPQ
jgi:hypothetical protein